MKAQIVNVGNGACSVYTGEESLMVTDCGEGPRGKGKSSARKLDQVVRGDSGRIETIVVTHFDADHWKGLQAYPALLKAKKKSGTLPRHVDFRIPRFPRGTSRLAAAQLVLEAALATSTGSLGASLDLFGAWRRAGVRVTVHPTARQETFAGANETWTCHWPPRDITVLPPQSQTAIGRLSDELDEVARQVPEFDEALRIAYGIGWVSNNAQPEANDFNSTLTGGQLLIAIYTFQPTLDIRAIIGRLRRYNNAFSLVHDFVDEKGKGLLVNFGDCEKMGLDSLLKLQNDPQELHFSTPYEYLLAPHHGTQEPKACWWPSFPRVGTSVVAQNGSTHLQRQKTPFLESLSPTPPQLATILNTHGSTSPITFTL